MCSENQNCTRPVIFHQKLPIDVQNGRPRIPPVVQWDWSNKLCLCSVTHLTPTQNVKQTLFMHMQANLISRWNNRLGENQPVDLIESVWISSHLGEPSANTRVGIVPRLHTEIHTIIITSPESTKRHGLSLLSKSRVPHTNHKGKTNAQNKYKSSNIAIMKYYQLQNTHPKPFTAYPHMMHVQMRYS